MSVVTLSVSISSASTTSTIRTVIKVISTIVGIGGRSEIPCWSAGNASENGGTYVLCSTCASYPGDYKGPQGTCKP